MRHGRVRGYTKINSQGPGLVQWHDVVMPMLQYRPGNLLQHACYRDALLRLHRLPVGERRPDLVVTTACQYGDVLTEMGECDEVKLHLNDMADALTEILDRDWEEFDSEQHQAILHVRDDVADRAAAQADDDDIMGCSSCSGRQLKASDFQDGGQKQETCTQCLTKRLKEKETLSSPHSGPSGPQTIMSQDVEVQDGECPICFEFFSHEICIIALPCGTISHPVCKPCMQDWANTQGVGHFTCPTCRASIPQQLVAKHT